MAVTTNYTGIAYIEEIVEGETPATPQFQILPTTGGSPVSNISTAVSEVIRADRQTDDLVVVDSEVGGELNYELSYDPYKPFMKALLQNDTIKADINETDITAVGASSELGKTSIETLLLIGDIFEVTSETDPTIDGVYTVTALGTNLVTVSPALPIAASATDLVAFASISITGATAVGASDFITNTDIHTIISEGDVFKVTSATESVKVDGVYTCIATTTDQITVYPSFPDNTAAATDLVLTAINIIKNGSDAPKTYTFRKTADNNGTLSYWYYRGIKISTMNWNFATGSILNGTFSVLGLTEEATGTPITGEQTDINVPDYSIMNSVSSIGTIYLVDDTGVQLALGTCSFQSLDLTYDNQITAAKSISVLGACETASYSVQITGSVEVYFKDLDLYNKFLNAESFGVTIILTDGDGNSIGMNMPKCKFETLDTPISGKDQFLMQSGSFRALREATDDYMFKLSLIDKLP